jgi:hypothetical protein
MTTVTPAPGFRRDRVAGVQKFLVFLDSGFRRNDRKERFLTSYETVKLRHSKFPGRLWRRRRRVNLVRHSIFIDFTGSGYLLTDKGLHN